MELLVDKCLVLDGGLATELMTVHGHRIDGDPLWSSRMISTHPDDISNVHTSYLLAGSDVIETSTYQASIEGFKKHLNVDHDGAVGLFLKAIELCTSARDKFWTSSELNKKQEKKPLIAGSVGPYGACLEDGRGSEYTGDYVDLLSVQELVEWHRPRVETLCRSGVDVVAFETIPAEKEAEAIVELMREFPYSLAWITFSCKDNSHTCHNEEISSVVKKIIQANNIIGVGVNCTKPMYVGPLVENISQTLNETKRRKAIVIYPDSGECWTMDNSWVRKDDFKPIYDYIPGWIDSGANWIGGCCMVTPNDISMIRSNMMTHSKLMSQQQRIASSSE